MCARKLKNLWLALMQHLLHCSRLEPNPQYLRGMPVNSNSFSSVQFSLLRVPLRSQAYCGLGRRSRNSTGFGAMAKVLISSWGRNLRVPLHFKLRPQGPWRAGTGESGLVLCGGIELLLPLELFTGWQATCRSVWPGNSCLLAPKEKGEKWDLRGFSQRERLSALLDDFILLCFKGQSLPFS